MRQLLAFLLILLFNISYSQHSIKVTITGIEEVKGDLAICLNQDASIFPNDCVYSKRVAVTGKTVSFMIEGIKPGTYAASVYQDKNRDQELNTNFIGIPKEKYGFSNNPNSTFGVPDFDECTFSVPATTEIVIEI